MPISSTSPDSADAPRRALAEIAPLKLTVEKLTLQLLMARRAQFGSSSEQLERQIALIECEPLDEQRAAEVAAKATANRESVDRRLPARLLREEHVHRPHTTNARTTPRAMPAAARRAEADCAASVRTSRSNWSTCLRASR